MTLRSGIAAFGALLALSALTACSQSGGAGSSLEMQAQPAAFAAGAPAGAIASAQDVIEGDDPALPEAGPALQMRDGGEQPLAQQAVLETGSEETVAEAALPGVADDAAAPVQMASAFRPDSPVASPVDQAIGPDPTARRERAVAFSSRDHECLARAMYFESNRSSREGMVAVGSVVMNRLETGKWGNTVCNVVGAPKQFAPGVMTRSMSTGADMASEAARSVLKGERHPKVYKDVLFFHTAGYRYPYNNMHYVVVAGGNSFYEKRRRMRGMANRPQSAILAAAKRGGSATAAVAEPVKAVITAPVRAVKKVAPIVEEAILPSAAPEMPVATAPVRVRATPVNASSGKTGRVGRIAPATN